MLTRLIFNAGSSPSKSGLDFPLSPVTIFVGPNNSGKSRALIEIEGLVNHAQTSAGQVVQKLEFEPWDKEAFESEINKIQVRPGPSLPIRPDQVALEGPPSLNNPPQRVELHRDRLVAEAVSPNGDRNQYACYLKMFTLRMDGQSRLSLSEDKPSGDLLESPTNYLAKLIQDDVARKEIRRIVLEAFGKYLVVDPTRMGGLRLRLSARAPTDDTEEIGWDHRAREFHRAAILLADAGDGVKAFVGMITALIAGGPMITLIDEPEAFLHPTLCAQLGKEITSALKEDTKRRLFIATHSAHFLMGCIQGGAQMNIVRLTFDTSSATARLLTKERLVPLMRNPLLRSLGVLNALFYNAVVVTEADSDRAFYQEINERLLNANDPRGIDGCLFLNAQNKQTIWDIVQPLRELGIPAVGIVDIDVLKEGGAVWAKPMQGAFIPKISHPALNTERLALLEAFVSTGKDMKRDGGIKLLPVQEQEACKNFFEKLAEYGIAVVPTGEVESWLESLPVKRTKNEWLRTIFEAMGEDPSLDAYTRPADDDVWDFVGSIAHWVKDSKRKGIPD